MDLSLDHLTVADCTPAQLLGSARVAGFGGVCMFLTSMEAVPAMPPFSLVDDLAMRRDVRAMLEDSGLRLRLAYPFTLSGRTHAPDLKRALDCAAELGAETVNALIYDRNPARRAETLSKFSDLAQELGMRVAVEFYPCSQVRTLDDALRLIDMLDRRSAVGINVDILHLVRSGGRVEDLSRAAGSIMLGQLCDGPADRSESDLEHEASRDRQLPGEGKFPLANFVAALPVGCPVSVEAPQDAKIAMGVRPEARARQAFLAVQRACATAAIAARDSGA